jgi:hypothetical protein
VQDALKAALDWACSQTGWWHDAGNLDEPVLRAIVRHALRIGARQTAETGCGLSTVVLSLLADSHICFTIAAGNALQRVQQLTLGQHSFYRPLDFVLIDGPHGFPFTHLEYFHFYPKIRKGGLLIVDDIHIPTIRQLYDVLCDDRMWTHIEDVENTAFFQRTDAPIFDPNGDGWETQQFNQRHFSDAASMDIFCHGWRERMPPPPGPLLGEGPAAGDNGAQAETARLKSEVDALRSSTSWRVTAPLRALSSVLRRR